MGYAQPGSGMVKALLGIVVLVAVLGALATFGLVNGNTAIDRAEAARIQADVSWEIQMRQMEIPYMEAKLQQEAAIVAAESNKEIARIEAEKVAYSTRLTEEQRLLVESNKLRLINRERWQMVGMGLVSLLGIVSIIAAGVAVIRLLFRLIDQIIVTNVAAQRHPLQVDPEYRHWRISQARQQEVLEREKHWATEMNGVPRRNGNGRSSIRA